MLNWAIIGCGDVVQRLVQDSLFVRNKSNVMYVVSDNLKDAKNYGKKQNIKHILSNSKKNLSLILKDQNHYTKKKANV